VAKDQERTPPKIDLERVVERTENKSTQVLLTGDVMLGRNVMAKSLDLKDHFYPFRKVSEVLKHADITFINLENPIVSGCARHTDGFTFCTTPEIAKGIEESGIDVVSLANNHTQNYSQNGLNETLSFLEGKGILVTGVGELVTKEVEGTKFGFLGFDKAEVVYPKLTQTESNLIKDSASKVDVLIIAMHWGVEYQSIALPGIKELAAQLVSLGADIIVGHHPHWVQDIECFNETGSEYSEFSRNKNGCPADSKVVYYSLGNFIFDQMWSEETRKGMVVRLTFEKNRVIKEDLINTSIRNAGQPEVVN